MVFFISLVSLCTSVLRRLTVCYIAVMFVCFDRLLLLYNYYYIFMAIATIASNVDHSSKQVGELICKDNLLRILYIT
jgi:hypothetical protein